MKTITEEKLYRADVGYGVMEERSGEKSYRTDARYGAMKTITEERLENFKLWLRNDVRANEGTVNQYIDKLGTLEEFLGDGEITKESLEAFKNFAVP